MRKNSGNRPNETKITPESVQWERFWSDIKAAASVNASFKWFLGWQLGVPKSAAESPAKLLEFARKLHRIQLSSINMQVQAPLNAREDLLVGTLRMRHLMTDVADRRGKIARLLKSGELISLRRGLYARRRNIDALGLAGPIYGPSYVSFETALAKHGMIPEGVVETISATTKRGVVFTNDFGRFRYLPVPKAVYPVGVCLVTNSDLPFLMASPTKALCDRIAREGGFRSLADVDHWLEDMRVDFETKLDPSELKMCADGYGRSSVRLLHQFALKKGYTK